MKYVLDTHRLADLFRHAARNLGRAWKFLRRVSGDDAYERYLEFQCRHHPHEKIMTPREYYSYLAEQKSKHGRCC